MIEEDASISKLAMLLYRDTQRYLDRSLSRCGLGCGNFSILLCLDTSPGINQNELSCRIGVDKALIARNLARLIEAGFIDRRPSPRDSRANNLFLSAQGERVVPQIRATLAEWNDRLAEGIPKDEIASARTLLRTIAENARGVIERKS